MSVCAFNFFSSGEYSNLFIVAAFPIKPFSEKPSLLFKKSYLLIIPDVKAEILKRHIIDCFKANGKQRFIMPVLGEQVKVKNYESHHNKVIIHDLYRFSKYISVRK